MTVKAQSKPSTHPFQERLNGEAILNAHGEPSQPSEALVFECDTPVPTMLVQRELNYLNWLASRLEGTGRVVELGCFLGGSTSALAGGLKGNSRSTKQILTYDCFETPPELSPHLEAWLHGYGLKPDQRFRDRFDQLNRNWLDQVTVHDGWIPSDATLEQEREVYPEQEPIELLFIDAAKTWDVHLTVLRAFGRHLDVGAMMVHQDFFDMHVPWIPLHMWQLRDVLEPMDVLMGTPSISFQCTDNIADRLDDLWANDDLSDRDKRRSCWDRVYEYWSELIGEDASGFLHGHAAIHSLHMNDGEEFARYGRMYDAWSRSAESKGVYFTAGWPDEISVAPSAFESTDSDSLAVQVLSTECAIRGSRLDRPREGEETNFFPLKQRMDIWVSTIDRLRSEGHRRVALFGAGKHTSWLLNAVNFEDIEIACILDDSPTQSVICGVPVLAPEHAQSNLLGVSVILPSSDSFEPQILARLRTLYQDTPGIDTPPVYTHDDMKLRYTYTKGNLCPQWVYKVSTTEQKSQLHPLSLQRTLANDVLEREQLQLPASRGWLDAFYQHYQVPNWSVGYTVQSDGAFLWDLVEGIRPQTIVEIGTASGVSTALLVGAIVEFCSPEAKVYSYDVSTRCYFDPNRPIAAALGEMAPDLLDNVRIFTPADAVDAASQFKVSEVDFAFIDGDHSHPSPTLDLLSLLYSLKAGAWVALHDIELSQLRSASGEREWQHVTGAEKLFHSWPYEKIQPAGSCPEQRNIGAIRMPDNLADVVPHLLGLLRLPWEIHTKPSPEIARALARLGEFDQ